MAIRRVRYIIFLRDVLYLSLTAFGGPQAHLAMVIDMMVKKRGYIDEQGLIELYALCQILPGPTSTQTITSLGFRIGGPGLAYLTLLVWMFPAFCIMTGAALAVDFMQEMNISLDFLRFIQPMAVGIVAYSAYRISSSVISSRVGYFLMILSAFISYFLKNPFIFPVLLLAGGAVTASRYKKQPIEEKSGFKVNWTSIFIWLGVMFGAFVLWQLTEWAPIRIFDNFYRNGSLIFGGGQVLVPLLFTEFVEFKKYLTSEEFISGYAFVQAIPGPVFSFSSYVGALSLRDLGIGGQILGAFLATAGIFLPGTFFIFFAIRFWENLKKYRVVKASLEGINAVSSGMVMAATFLLFGSIEPTPINYFLMLGTACIIFFTKIPTPLIIIAGLLVGIILQ